MNSFPMILLKDLAAVKGGKRLPKGEQLSDSETKYPYIRVTDFSDKGVDVAGVKYITENIQRKISRYVISKDDVYISIAGTIGLVGTIPDCLDGANLTENAAKIVIHKPDKLDRDYLVWYLSTAGQRHIQSKKKTTSQPKLALFRIEEIEIPLPPLKEQKRIAAILDKADNLRRKRQQAIQLADEFLRAVFLDMFGDPVTNPKGWDVAKIGNGIDSIASGWSAKGSSEPCTPGGIGVLKISAVTSGTFLPKENKAIDPSIVPKGKSLIFPKAGDLLFSRANTRELVAATCIVSEDQNDVFLPDKLWVVKTQEEKLLPEFLHYMMWQPRFKDLLTSQATGTSGSMLNISKAKFEETDAIFPSMDLQDKFKSIYWKCQSILDEIKGSSICIEECFGSLSKNAFSGSL